MTATQIRSIWAVSAMAIGLLASGLVKAAEPNDYVASWIGEYTANGKTVGYSNLQLELKAGAFAGNWDGYKVIGSKMSGDKLILTLNPNSDKYGAAPGVSYYIVECTYNRDRSLSLTYYGADADGRAIPGRQGGTVGKQRFYKP